MEYLIGSPDQTKLNGVASAVERVHHYAIETGEEQDDAQSREVYPQRSVIYNTFNTRELTKQILYISSTTYHKHSKRRASNNITIVY